MALDYKAIKDENIKRYGTDIDRIGPMLLSNRYDNRTHFIFELLQNAEDALIRRTASGGPRSVTFYLSKDSLRVSHYGELFSEPDVKGICGIGESTKSEKLTQIGRFGIGFKSVYAFTDAPEVHSGEEHFAIDSFVWPRKIAPVASNPDETVFVIPFRHDDLTAHGDIASGLQALGVRILLFLKEIEEISWNADGGPSGLYLRSKPEAIAENARKALLIGQGGEKEVDETWLIFSREIETEEGTSAGCVEIAFALNKIDNESFSVRRVHDSPLVVFFPTIVSTNLGFLIQGPYRTTPSRDNVPKHDKWNQHLVQETATLLIVALRRLREEGLLSVETLRTLPIDRARFGEGSMFGPLFDAVHAALSSEALLPRFGGGHISASAAMLARTQELRELLSPQQLTALFHGEQEIAWLSEEITQDRTPELRQYLMRELDIVEVVPDTILPKLTQSFLQTQGDEWIVLLYEFLQGQPAWLRSGKLNDIPIIRLEDGSHVVAWHNGQPQAFLPGSVSTGFPTVRREVCQGKGARAFLIALGLTEPDPVDDVVWNVLPKYAAKQVDVSDAEYVSDIGRILTAFRTDSKNQREKLLTALRESNFVMAIDTGTGAKYIKKPGEVYLATQRLKDLFEGVADVLLVDDSYASLRGEDVRELLEACGATRCLLPIPIASRFTWEEKRNMRRKAGCENCTYDNGVDDYTLRGLQQLIDNFRSLDAERAKIKAELLWESLCDVEDRRGARAFLGTYRWKFHYARSCEFDARFLRQLNAASWVPHPGADLRRPEFVVFNTLGWRLNPFLLSKIHFKPPIIETLAREAGIEPGLLDLLKKIGVTSEAELKARLGIIDTEEPQQPGEKPGPLPVNDTLKQLGASSEPTSNLPKPAGPEPTGSGNQRRGTGSETDFYSEGDTKTGSADGSGSQSTAGESGRTSETGSSSGRPIRAPGSPGGRPFISYLGAHPEDEEVDPDGLLQQERMNLEEKAIGLILSKEAQLQRTSVNNPGFDLVEYDAQNQPVRWIEVKAMAGTLQDRPVCLSRKQFEHAQQHGNAYWLYIVEQAGSDGNANLLRIQNPAGKALSFTFDQGWADIAENDTD